MVLFDLVANEINRHADSCYCQQPEPVGWVVYQAESVWSVGWC